MIIPFKVDVPQKRWPISNYMIILFTTLVFVWQTTISPDHGKYFILDGWHHLPGIFGSIWIHAHLLHLIGNLIFLWIFGNAVCAKVGNLRYFVCYLALGLFETIVYLIIDGRPCLGASGVINGIVGMYLVLYYRNSISCLFMFFLYIRVFSVASFWMILYWFAFDIIGILLGNQGIAYWAHLSGLMSGIILSTAFLKFKWIVMDRHEESIFMFYKHFFDRFKKKEILEEIEIEPEIQWPVVSQDAMSNKRSGPNGAQTKNDPLKNMPHDKDKGMQAQSAPPNFIRFNCHCGKQLKISILHGGESGICPRCNQKVDIPIE